MREQIHPPDHLLAAVAARQYGVVTIAQLDTVGISPSGVTRRIRSGRLHRVHRGVYAVGHPGLGTEGVWMAAVLASGPDAVLSHRSAAALWGLLPSVPGVVDVSIPHRLTRRKQPDIRVHRSRHRGPEHTTVRQRIPVTTPAKTIADLRRAVSPAQLRRAIREAEVQGLKTGTERELEATSSELERRFLGLCRGYRLPRPEVNVAIGPFLVDFLWRPRRLIVETDGYRYHRGRQAFEDDRARDVELRLMGFEVARFTYRQVVEDAHGVAKSMRELLDRPSVGGVPTA